MIKIVSITNAHAWDGKEMTRYQLANVQYALSFSNCVHTISFYDEDGELQVTFIGGNS